MSSGVSFWIPTPHKKNFRSLISNSKYSRILTMRLGPSYYMTTVSHSKKSSKSVGILFNQFDAFWALSCILFNIFAQTLICDYFKFFPSGDLDLLSLYILILYMAFWCLHVINVFGNDGSEPSAQAQILGKQNPRALKGLFDIL